MTMPSPTAQTERLRVLDLFSGIGGFSLGLERTGGFETVAFCEIEEFPRRVLAKHWPGVPCYEDVRDLTAARLAADGIAVDVITGGFPCQDASIAAFPYGRDGIGGSRTGLYEHGLRLAAELGVPWVILENVRGLLANGLVPVLQGLREIGYDAEWHCIPASALGSVQNRDRVWVVAYPRGQRVEGLLARGSIGALGSGWACGPADLLEIYADPFGGDRWPQPIIRGGDNRPANWVDRVKALGNAVVPQIPEMIGNAILEAERQRTDLFGEAG